MKPCNKQAILFLLFVLFYDGVKSRKKHGRRLLTFLIPIVSVNSPSKSYKKKTIPCYCCNDNELFNNDFNIDYKVFFFRYVGKNKSCTINNSPLTEFNSLSLTLVVAFFAHYWNIQPIVCEVYARVNFYGYRFELASIGTKKKKCIAQNNERITISFTCPHLSFLICKLSISNWAYTY